MKSRHEKKKGQIWEILRGCTEFRDKGATSMEWEYQAPIPLYSVEPGWPKGCANIAETRKGGLANGVSELHLSCILWPCLAGEVRDPRFTMRGHVWRPVQGAALLIVLRRWEVYVYSRELVGRINNPHLKLCK